MTKTGRKNSFLLFLTACIWGMAFVSQSKGMEYMPPFTFNGIRSLIGAFVLLIYLVITRKCTKNRETISWKVTLQAGLWCGLALTVASTLQQFGIQYTTVGKAGFITALYIIFVPLTGIFVGKKIAKPVWFAAGMAAFGMYLLCLTGSLRPELGDGLVFLCALVFTAHILIIDYYAPKTDGVIVSCIQFAVCGLVCGVCALMWDKPDWSGIASGTGTLLYAGVLSCGVAYTLQIVGQKDVNPAVAALILSLESVIATVSGWVAYKIGFLKTDQTMTVRQIIGCIIVFAAVILVQLPDEFLSGITSQIHRIHKNAETKSEKS